MRFPTKNLSELGRTYRDGSDEGKEREAAAFVRPDGEGGGWMYHSRGTVTEARNAILNRRPGFIGGVADFAPEDVRVCLDQPSWGERDTKDLCWGGPTMSVPDFMDWYEGKLADAS